MKLRRTLHTLAFTVALLPCAEALSRGGETGTLDEGEGPSTTSVEPIQAPVEGWRPYFLPRDQFRRLRARLRVRPTAPIPGTDGKWAMRFLDRYFTEDGQFEILPQKLLLER